MSENTKPFNEQDFGSISPGVFSAVRFLETISCQLADAAQFMQDLECLNGGHYSPSECVALTEAARVLRRRCSVMNETLEGLNFLKHG